MKRIKQEQHIEIQEKSQQLKFRMPEDRRKCIPSMVTIMEISVYLEITKG